MLAVLVYGIAVLQDGDDIAEFFTDLFLALPALALGAVLGVIYVNEVARLAEHREKTAKLGWHAMPAIALTAALFVRASGIGAEPRGDGLAARFRDNRPALEKLVAMTRQDPAFAGICDSSGANSDSVKTLGETRVSAYLSVMHSGRVKCVNLDDDKRVYFSVWMQGCTPCTDTEKGIVFSPKPPKPVVKDLDAARKAEGSYTLFQHLDGNWYAYYRQVD